MAKSKGAKKQFNEIGGNVLMVGIQLFIGFVNRCGIFSCLFPLCKIFIESCESLLKAKTMAWLTFFSFTPCFIISPEEKR